MAARARGARVLVTSDTRCFSASSLLLCFGLSSASKFWKLGFPNLGAKQKTKKKGPGAPKHQSIFASAISMFLFSKDSEVLKKKPAARRAEFFFWASEQKSLIRAMVLGESRRKLRSRFGHLLSFSLFFGSALFWWHLTSLKISSEVSDGFLIWI